MARSTGPPNRDPRAQDRGSQGPRGVRYLSETVGSGLGRGSPAIDGERWDFSRASARAILVGNPDGPEERFAPKCDPQGRGRGG